MAKGIFIILAVLFMSSCTKYVVENPGDFAVTTDKTSYAAGDVVTFNFTGNPNYIIFYSGEIGKKFEMSNISSVKPDSVTLNFSTNTTAASTSTQPLAKNSVSLLVSNDFTGILDQANIKKATWSDISSKATWATSTSTIASGTLQVNSYRVDGKPVYFAFRYVSDTVKTNYLARKWTIASFMLRSFYGGEINPLAGGNSGTNVPFLTAGFNSYSIMDSTNNWVFGNTSLVFNAPAVGALPNEDWSISRPFDFTIYTPDVGVGIKTPAAKVYSYQYKFTTPGTYTVTFLGKNQSSEKTEQVVRQLNLTIN